MPTAATAITAPTTPTTPTATQARPAHRPQADRRLWLQRGLQAGAVAAAGAGLGTAGLMGGCAWLQPAPRRVDQPLAALPPGRTLPALDLPRELRGAWVASVDHIDWPSRPGLSSAQQRDEALRLMDAAAELGLNALMLQVRPAADALYPSALEPWSEYLTGEQGRSPEGDWDPLAFWIDGAHRRGLELHAWFNPYRARHPSATGPLAASHIARRRPNLVRRYGDMLWMDPAEPDAAAHTLAVVADVLDRYDIDGVHIDDYFYPYPVRDAATRQDQPFPDDAPWARHQAAGGGGNRADWRRAQVDALVQALHTLVRQRRPDVRFGISPFGLPQPALRPPGITGFSQYDKLYADVERWLREGWMDYCAPQLYWPIDRAPQAFAVLADAWTRLNPRGVAMWPGLFTSRVGAAERAWPAAEVLDQIGLLRKRAGIGGHIHFSLVALAQNRDGIASRLRAGPYARPAAVPVAAAVAADIPPAPRILAQPGDSGSWRLTVLPDASPATGSATPAVRQWAVWREMQGQWQLGLQPGPQLTLDAAGASAVVVQALGAGGQAGPARLWWPGVAARDDDAAPLGPTRPPQGAAPSGT